jgi:hypothetical protein
MSLVAGTARMHEQCAFACGSCWASGDAFAGLRWLAGGRLCADDHVRRRAYMVPDLYMPCRMEVLVYLSQGIICRYKNAIVVL